MGTAKKLKKVSKKLTNNDKRGGKAQRASENPQGDLVSIQVEYPKSNFVQLHEIAERFRKRYDELIDSGHFSDLQKEFQQVMNGEGSGPCLVVDLRISLYDYDWYYTEPTQIRRSIIRFRSSQEMGTYRDNTFVCAYMVDNEIVIANNEICPACGHEWRHKLPLGNCPHCERVFGGNMYFVIEDDRCPHCNHKGISESGMVCENCHREVPEEMIVRLKR